MANRKRDVDLHIGKSPPPPSLTLWLWRDKKLRLDWRLERRLGLQRDKDRRGRERERERESVALLSGIEFNQRRLATMWVSSHFYTMIQDFDIIWNSIAYLYLFIAHASLVYLFICLFIYLFSSVFLHMQHWTNPITYYKITIHVHIFKWTFRFHKLLGISWLASNQLASQEGLCTME